MIAGDSLQLRKGSPDSLSSVDGDHIDAAAVIVVPGGATAAILRERPNVGGSVSH